MILKMFNNVFWPFDCDYLKNNILKRMENTEK